MKIIYRQYLNLKNSRFPQLFFKNDDAGIPQVLHNSLVLYLEGTQINALQYIINYKINILFALTNQVTM